MKNLATVKRKIGIALIKFGAKLVFKNDCDLTKLKNAINYNTTIGSYADSGDHLRGSISPMCEYSTQSVINVLKHGDIDCEFAYSEKITYYKEKWQ